MNLSSFAYEYDLKSKSKTDLKQYKTQFCGRRKSPCVLMNCIYFFIGQWYNETRDAFKMRCIYEAKEQYRLECIMNDKWEMVVDCDYNRELGRK